MMVARHCYSEVIFRSRVAIVTLAGCCSQVS